MFRKEVDTIEGARESIEDIQRRIRILERMVDNARGRRNVPLGCINCHAHVDNVELSGVTRDNVSESIMYAYTCSVCGDVFRLEVGEEALIVYGNDFTRTIRRPVDG